jgi:hypothetical protein
VREDLVTNAADEHQVKRASKKETARADQDYADMKRALQDAGVRRIFWKILERCKTFQSVCHPSGSMTYYNSGQQDVGHWLMSEIVKVNDQALVAMMQENKKEI